jgi:hypothetical protein
VKKIFPLFALVVAVIVAGAIPASADVLSSVSFNEACPVCSVGPGGTAVDMMKVFIQPPEGGAGVQFATPGLAVYGPAPAWAPSGWTENDVSTTYSNASGSAMSNFNYILNFDINSAAFPSGTVKIGVDVYYFQNIAGIETLIDQAGLTYNGPISFNTPVNDWLIPVSGDAGTLNERGLAGENQVPEPTSILLLGSVIFGLAFGFRKKLA